MELLPPFLWTIPYAQWPSPTGDLRLMLWLCCCVVNGSPQSINAKDDGKHSATYFCASTVDEHHTVHMYCSLRPFFHYVQNVNDYRLTVTSCLLTGNGKGTSHTYRINEVILRKQLNNKWNYCHLFYEPYHMLNGHLLQVTCILCIGYRPR